MKQKLKSIMNHIQSLPWRLASRLKFYKGNKIPIKFISEDADWAIKTVGQNIKNEIDSISPKQIQITTKPYKVVSSVVHFGSQYMWLNWERYISSGNKYVVSFFHGKPEDGREVRMHIEKFLESVQRLQKVVTASSLVEKRLLNWGVPRNKLVKIPLGTNTNQFNLPFNDEKKLIRQKLGISTQFIVIGSFQKDGIGWGEGMDPKFIKGPDLFVSTLKLLFDMGYPVLALLTGPARGYVKTKLKDYGIPFVHKYPSNHNDLKSFYHALDIYLITSREEGGPMGLLESAACGTTVVSTDVGMAKDLIIDGYTGFLVDKIEVQELARKVEYFINLKSDEKNLLQKNARKAVCRFDWSIVAKEHWEKVYKPLITSH